MSHLPFGEQFKSCARRSRITCALLEKSCGVESTLGFLRINIMYSTVRRKELLRVNQYR